MAPSSLLLKSSLAALSILSVVSADLSLTRAIVTCFTIKASDTVAQLNGQYLKIAQNSSSIFTTQFANQVSATVFKLDVGGKLVAINGPGVFQPDDYPLVPAGLSDEELSWYTLAEFQKIQSNFFNAIQPACVIQEVSVTGGTHTFTCSAQGVTTLNECYGNSVHFVTSSPPGCQSVNFTAVAVGCPPPPPPPTCFKIKTITQSNVSYLALGNQPLDKRMANYIPSSIVSSIDDAHIFRVGGDAGQNILATTDGNVFSGTPLYLQGTNEEYSTSYFMTLSEITNFNQPYFAPNCQLLDSGLSCTFGVDFYGSLKWEVCNDATLKFSGNSSPSEGCNSANISSINVDCPGLPISSFSSLPSLTSPATITTAPTSLTVSNTQAVTDAPTTTTNTISIGIPSNSSSSAVSTPSVAPQSPGRIGSWSLIGCIGSQSKFPTFTKVGTSILMTNELCITACPKSKYSATQGDDCFCATSLGIDTGPSFVAPGICDGSCPGNPFEICGGIYGSAGNSTVRRASLSRAALEPRAITILLTLYENAAYDPAVPTEVPTSPITINNNYTAGNIYVNVNAVIYIDICTSCAGGLAYQTLTTTLPWTACGCAQEPIPTCPMTIITKSCGCGPGGVPSTVILTLPVTTTGAVAGNGSGNTNGNGNGNSNVGYTTAIGGGNTAESAGPGQGRSSSSSVPITPSINAASSHVFSSVAAVMLAGWVLLLML